MDIKYAYYEKANEIAYDLYGKEYYDLDSETQYKIYNLAIEKVTDELYSKADRLKDFYD